MAWNSVGPECGRCMVWSRLHGYFKDSLTLCYKIQSTKIAIICMTAFLVWLSCFLISHQWDWAWCTSNQVWYFWLFCSPWPHISLPVYTLNTNFQKAKHFCDRKWHSSLIELLRVRLVHVFKNWKLLFKNFCGNICGWKSVWKCVQCYLKTENCCLKTLTKHPLSLWQNRVLEFKVLFFSWEIFYCLVAKLGKNSRILLFFEIISVLLMFEKYLTMYHFFLT